jgi:hypothetical protein
MAARTTRITYGQCLILASPTPAHQDNTTNLTGLKRVQSAAINFSFNRQRFKEIGSADYVGDVNMTNPDITLDMDYLYSNGTNEIMLGLDVDGSKRAVLNGLRAPAKDNNFYVLFGSGVRDEVSWTSSDSDFKDNYTVMALGNCFLNSYAIESSVGELTSVKANIQADNLTAEPYDNSVQGELIPAINPATMKPSSSNRYKIKKSFFQNTTNQDGLIDSAFAPSGIKLTLPEYVNVPGLEFTGADGAAFIDSFSLNFNIDRSPLYGFGSIYPYGRRAILPVLGNLSFTATASEFESGSLNDLVILDNNKERDYNFTIDMVAPSGTTGLKIQVEGAKVDGEGLSQSIDNFGAMEVQFSFSMSDTSGLKFSTPPLILSQPAGGSVAGGVSFGVVATGLSNLGYQWYKDGAVIGGATSSIYSPSGEGDYYAVITNDLGSATSNTAVATT